MTARPILFSAPMVRAILADTKTVTRRVVKPQPSSQADLVTPLFDPAIGWRFYGGPNLRCPYGEPADTLWVRESIHLKERWNEGREDRALSVYSADDEPTPADAWPWKRNNLPSIHCPRGLSRITLRVTSVRVERLQEITEADAVAEGVDLELVHRMGGAVAFRELWESINAVRAPWSSNPYVWVLEFERCQ